MSESPLKPAIDGIPWDRLHFFLAANSRQLDFAWHLLIYVPFLLAKTTTRHFQSSKAAKLGKLPYLPLLAHIGISFVLVWYYQYLAVTSAEPPLPGKLFAAAGMFNGLVSWRLCRPLTQGNPRLSRGAFQAFAIQLFIAGAMAWRSADPFWYHAVAKAHNGFSYVRLVLAAGRLFKMWSSYNEAYTIAVFLGGLLGVMEANVGLYGVPLTLVLMLALAFVERSISNMITPK
jgi:hypothetical protein